MGKERLQHELEKKYSGKSKPATPLQIERSVMPCGSDPFLVEGLKNVERKIHSTRSSEETDRRIQD